MSRMICDEKTLAWAVGMIRKLCKCRTDGEEGILWYQDLVFKDLDHVHELQRRLAAIPHIQELVSYSSTYSPFPGYMRVYLAPHDIGLVYPDESVVEAVRKGRGNPLPRGDESKKRKSR